MTRKRTITRKGRIVHVAWETNCGNMGGNDYEVFRWEWLAALYAALLTALPNSRRA